MRNDVIYRFAITSPILRDEWSRRAALALMRQHVAVHGHIPVEHQWVRFELDEPIVEWRTADYLVVICAMRSHRHLDSDAIASPIAHAIVAAKLLRS